MYIYSVIEIYIVFFLTGFKKPRRNRKFHELHTYIFLSEYATRIFIRLFLDRIRNGDGKKCIDVS